MPTLPAVGADTTTYTDTGEKPGTYLYFISAYNSGSNGQQESLGTAGAANIWPPGHLVAFDGTRDIENHDNLNLPFWDPQQGGPWQGSTVVSEFKNRYDDQNPSYIPGVGNSAATPNPLANIFASGFGEGAMDDVLAAVGSTIAYYNQTPLVNGHPIPLDIIGYSRGAMEAVEFANLIAQKLPQVEIRFVGLVSPVEMMGFPQAAVSVFTFGGILLPTQWHTSLPGSVHKTYVEHDQNPNQWGRPEQTITGGGIYQESQNPFDDHGQLGLDPVTLLHLAMAANDTNVPVSVPQYL